MKLLLLLLQLISPLLHSLARKCTPPSIQIFKFPLPKTQKSSANSTNTKKTPTAVSRFFDEFSGKLTELSKRKKNFKYPV
jgi:hypothetical protein